MPPIVVRRSPERAVVERVEHHVALVAGVVFRLAQRVRRTELQAVAVASVGAHLQTVVDRAARVLRQSNRAVPFVRPERGDVDAGIRLNRARQQLVDVAFARQVLAFASDVAHVDDDAARDLALHAHGPHIRRR